MTVFISGMRIAGSLLSIAMTIILARSMSASDFGNLGLLLSVVAVIGVVANLGFSQAVITASNPSNREAYGNAATITKVGLCISVVASMSIALCMSQLLNVAGRVEDHDTVALGEAFVSLSAISYFLGERLRSRNSLLRAALFGMYGTYGGLVQTAVMLAISCWRIHDGHLGLQDAVISLTFGAAACTIGLLWSTRSDLFAPLSAKSFDCRVWRRLLVLCLSSALSGATIALRGQILIWIGAALVVPAEFASFLAVSRLAAIFSIPVNIMGFTLTPYLIGVPCGDKFERRCQLRQLVSIVTFAIAPFVVVCCVFHRQIIAIAFGEPNTAASLSLGLLSINSLIQICMGGSNQVLLLYGWHRLHLVITIVTTVFGAVAALPLCWAFGANGIGLAGIATIAAYYLFIAHYTRKRALPVTWLLVRPSRWKFAITDR
jgi:O-antigen/teichoic acid export membrane protein